MIKKQLSFYMALNDLNMIRIYRCIRKYALDKNAMMARSECFYPEKSSQYSQDSIHYAYNLALHPGNVYEGIADIRFKLQKKGNLFMDFQGKTVKSVIVNSKTVNPIQVHKEGKIELPSKLLTQGFNNVSVQYQNQYDKDGSGCVSFIDVDKKQYLYTQFEPYMGNRVFPMFDQPDLKAKMKLSIACPSQWEAVLSNQESDQKNPNFTMASSVCSITKALLEKVQNQMPSNYKITNFQTTKLLPTYLFCFVVGPYKKYVSQNTYKNIQMNLYCIESLYSYMMKLVPFIEEMTNKSMEFFQKYFGYPYPFNKYDQVFAHEYKWGAMENAGIVTLNDLYIFKDPVSIEKMISFGNTIVHEMAHHWFGNLVTMKWWDDLWLNESFAEYISHFCLQKIKSEVKTINYESAMASFLNRKSWGYAQDQLVTTHPIRSDVKNTQVAESIFDGITYSKGAATMKQLMYLMGEDAFSKALKQYFHNYEFKNAELADLLKYMKKHYQAKQNVTIDEWRQMWLQKAGLNILSSSFDEKTSTLRVKQSAYHENHPTLRSHTIKVALIQSPKNIQQLQVVVKPTPITEIKLSKDEADKVKNAKAIVLNHKDLSFCKVILDQKSIQYLKGHLNQVDDILLRSMVWKNFFDMVKDAHLKSTDYIQILSRNLFQEKSDAILEENLNNALVAIQKYTPKQFRSKCYEQILQNCLKNNDEVNKNRSIIIRDKIIAFSTPENEGNIKMLLGWYYGKPEDKIGSPNITERWKIVIKILSSKLISKQDREKLLKNMIERDGSDTMKNRKLTCDALLLSQSETQRFFKKITQDPSQKWGTTSFVYSIAGLNNRIHQESLRANLKQKYFQAVKTSLEETDHSFQNLKKSQFIESFIDEMDPKVEDNISDLQQKVEAFSKIQVQKNDKIKIQLQKKVDLLKKRVKCFRLFDTR